MASSMIIPITVSACLPEYDPGVWTCSSDQDLRALAVANDISLEQSANKHPSILKHREGSFASYTSEAAMSERSDFRPDRQTATPSGRSRTEVTFEGIGPSDDETEHKRAPLSAPKWARQRPQTAAFKSHQPALLKFRRPKSAPMVLMSTSGFDDDVDDGEPHICSMTLYMDDYQHPGRTTKLTLSYTKSNMANARLLSTDITRYAKRRENLMQHNIKQTENRLHAQRIRREERIRQKEAEIWKLKKLEEEATQRYKLIARSLQETNKKSNSTLLTKSEREQFRKTMIRRRTTLIPTVTPAWKRSAADRYTNENMSAKW